jgi:hypothetical protein
MTTTAKNPLVGKHFHILVDREIAKMGIVRGDLGGGNFLLQYFSWMDGSPNIQQIVKLDAMMTEDWQFYDTAADMNAWGHHYSKTEMHRQAQRDREHGLS